MGYLKNGSAGTALLSSVGLACYFSWDTIALFAPLLPLSSSFPIEQSLIFSILSYGVLITSFLVAAGNADKVHAHKNAVLLASGLLSCAAIALAFASTQMAEPPQIIGVMLWVCLGLGRAGLSLIWSAYLSLSYARTTSLTISGALLITPLIFFLVVIVESHEQFFLLCGIFALGSTVIAGVVSNYDFGKRKAVLKMRKLSSYISDNGVIAVMQGVLQGFVLVTLMAYGMSAVLYGVTGMLIGNALALISIVLARQNDYDVPLFMNRAFPFFLLVLLVMPFFNDVGRIFSCCAICISVAYSASMTWLTTTASYARFNLNPVTHAGYGRVPNLVGVALGYAIALTFFFLSDPAPEAYSLAVVLLASAMLVAFALRGSEAVRLWFTPVPHLVVASPERADSEQGHAERARAEDIQQGNTQPIKAEQDPSQKKRRIQERCFRVIIDNDLTPREADIFMLLAKGFGAESISDQLAVPPSTAKAHINRIYLKLGVGSQRTFLDMMDWLDASDFEKGAS